MTISKAAAASGVSARMIRHYEGLGFLPTVQRLDSGYRMYTPADVHTLCFIKRSRDLGFSIAEIAQLLSLWQDTQRSNLQVRQIAQQHLDDLQRRIASMQAMHASLAQLVQSCSECERPECPILQDLAGVTDSLQ